MVFRLNPSLLTIKGYDPNPLLNECIRRNKLNSDADLARLLKLAPPAISKIRHRANPISPMIFIRLHELGGMSFADMRRLCNIQPDVFL